MPLKHLLLSIFLVFAGTLAADAGPPVITAVRVDEVPRLDGRLDDNPWRSAIPISGFTQRELQEGEPATEQTSVRIVYTQRALYLGVFCYDREPDKIVAEELARDFDIFKDDDFEIAIDTYLDHRNGFFFAVNPNGARNDALFTDEGLTFNGDWNGLWDCRAAVNDSGWTCEIEIPFSTLRYSAETVQTWGINFERNIKRKREQLRWTAWERSYRLLHMSHAGVLTGLADLPRKNPLYLKPYVLGGIEKFSGNVESTETKAGGDLKYSITPSLTLDLTANTDFAQVEVDQEQINLTRFPLFFPEKRDFFLEGAEYFETQFGGIKPFYSRRIGLTDDGREVPIIGGARLVGQAGKYKIGLLSMQTAEKHGQPSTNYSVGRVRREVGSSSYIGSFVTNVERSNAYNRLLGVDAFHALSNVIGTDRMFLGGAIAGSKEPGIRDDNLAWRAYSSFPGETVNNWAGVRAVQTNYNPGIGYTGRDEFINYTDELHFYLRPGRWGIQYFDLMPAEFDYFVDRHGEMQTYTHEIRPLAVMTNSGELFELNFRRRAESFAEDFSIFSDVVVPRGDYWWNEYEFYAGSNDSRRLSANGAIGGGPALGGDYYYVGASGALRLNKYLSWSAFYEYQDFDLTGGEFITRQITGRINAGVNPRLTSSVFMQWNNDADEASANIRIHWIPKIGSDAYLVYTQRYDTSAKLKPTGTTLMAKIAYLFTL